MPTEARNRDAFKDYILTDAMEAGIVLTGAEVKSIRLGRASWSGSYAAVEKNNVFLYGLHIEPYQYDTTRDKTDSYDPTHPRKLLLKAKEIQKLKAATQAEGFTLVPLKLYFKKALIKVELALGKGKKKFDKRAEMKRKTQERETERFFKYK
jgi:SsrA-binding protein